jgi:hypothetical protein
MKTGRFSFAAVLLSGLLFSILFTTTSCKKDPLNPINAIELSGTQSTPRVLEKVFDTPLAIDYIVTGQWTVEADVVVNPGVNIVMKPGASINVRGGGSFKAIGTIDRLITIRGESPTAGYWGYLLFQSNNANNVLEHVLITDGGGDNSWNASVYCYQNGRLSMRNSSISNSQRYGFLVYSPEFNLDAFSSNAISGSQLAPISILAPHMGRMDALTQFNNNGLNHIEVDGGSIAQVQTWARTQLPFLLKTSIEINSAVVVSPGTSVLIGAGQRLVVQASGSLSAIGTPTERITFSGTSPTKGSWGYILFQGTNNVANNFQNVDISYGGGDASWDASVYLYQGARLRIGNSSITNSQRWGLINYANANTFDNDGNNIFSGNDSGDIGN